MKRLITALLAVAAGLTVSAAELQMAVMGNDAGNAAVGAATPTPNDGLKHAFTLGTNDFLLDGKPFQLRAGEIHPERIPAAYWRHRIQMAKAMGLNAVAIYIFWNAHETTEGRYDFTAGNLDTAKFLQIAKEEGMWVLFRPGPYCCGEWDLGGIPPYLLRDPDIKLRCMDDRYTAAVAHYYHELAKIVRPHLVANGGTIVMVQIENEYGSYPRRDHTYMVWLRDLWVKEGVPGPFYTADGAGENYLKGIVIPGVAVGLDTGSSEAHWNLARKMNPGVPVFSAEVYPGWLRHWGEGNWKPSDISGLVKFYMDTGKSFNLYMLHGGTSFGLTAGVNNGGNGYQPDLTSYDYGSPVDEQGRATPAYEAFRTQLAAYLPAGETLPDVPAPIPTIEIPSITLERWTSLWEQLPKPVRAEQPAFFESLGQNQGLMLYRTKIPGGDKRPLTMANVHDYAQVFVDGKPIGTLDRRLGQSRIELPACEKVAMLEILVEAMGHINFSGDMDSDRKGIYGDVKLGGAPLTNWDMFPWPIADRWITGLKMTTPAADRPGGIFRGSFKLDTVADTFLDMSQHQKGYVWINGHNLGRYWHIGPQQRLYCPGTWLKRGKNEIIVLDLHQTTPRPVAGMTSSRDEVARVWKDKALKLAGIEPALTGELEDHARPQLLRLPATASARYLCLEAVSTHPGLSSPGVASVAELEVLDAAGNVLPCKVAYVDSEDTGSEDNRAEKALDGNPATVWHTAWEGGVPPLPHQIVVDLGNLVEVAGLRVQSRADQRDGKANGRIKNFRLYTSLVME